MVLKVIFHVYNLQFASVEFAGYARHRACSCSLLPQALDNAADPVKSAFPTCWGEAESEAQRVNCSLKMVNFLFLQCQQCGEDLFFII
ncbi:hypothetical protein, partial [Desulfobacula sp.]|uniref:hypothetical protein n=1 Tax=Desulfobacula sp. TaxID=2593537 RepID=UPI0039B82458